MPIPILPAGGRGFVGLGRAGVTADREGSGGGGGGGGGGPDGPATTSIGFG